MATAAQLRLPEGRDATVEFDPIWLGRAPYDLTSRHPRRLRQAIRGGRRRRPVSSRDHRDSRAERRHQVTDGPGGLATLTIDGSVIPVPGTLFWHLDATDGTGATGTIAYGPVYVEATG